MPGHEAMSHAVVRMHEREGFGSKYASALMMPNPTMNNRRNQLSEVQSLKRQMHCRKSSSSYAEETDLPITTHTTVHTQIKHQLAGQS